MKNFDCQAMPEEVKDLFFDTYRLPNNSTVLSFVQEERKPILDWLVANGAELNEEGLKKTIEWYRKEKRQWEKHGTI